MAEPYHKVVAAEAANDLMQGLLKTTHEVLKAHGNDPLTHAIVAAGYALALKELNRTVAPSIAHACFREVEGLGP